MPEETILTRLIAIEQQLDQANEALDRCRTDFDIGSHVERANTRDIEKLKRHVAKLQADAKPEATALNIGTSPAE